MNNYFLINLTVKGILIISVLTLAGGCATQTKKTEVPAPLESEMRSIADQKASTTYQPQIQSEKATYYVVKKRRHVMAYIKKLWSICECNTKG